MSTVAELELMTVKLLCDRLGKKRSICSVPLRTGTCYFCHFCVVFARLLCSGEITEFHISSSPTLCASNDVTSSHAHSLCSERCFPWWTYSVDTSGKIQLI